MNTQITLPVDLWIKLENNKGPKTEEYIITILRETLEEEDKEKHRGCNICDKILEKSTESL